MRTQWFVHGVLAVWACLMILIGGSLMVSHWVPLPRPEIDDAAWSVTLANAQSELATGRWTALHFLYAECPCSRRVLEHVIDQSPRADVWERIVLIGNDPELAERIKSHGYEVDCVSPDELKLKYGVEAAPLLVVSDPQGTPRYAGGYTSRKQGPDIQDRKIIASLMAGQHVEAMPLYGCAVSRSLQSIVDPLGLKSRKEQFHFS